MGRPSDKDFMRRYTAAAETRNRHLGTWRTIYRYLFPYRSESPETAVRSSYTSFARTRVREFQSRFVAGTTPLFQQWIRYQVPDEVGRGDRKRLQGEVDRLNAALWRGLGRSRWTTSFGRLIGDAGIGIGAVLIEKGPAKRAFNIEVEAVANMAFEADPWGECSGYWRERTRTARQIKLRWPGASLPKAVIDALSTNENQPFETIEGVVRDTDEPEDEVWYHLDILKMDGTDERGFHPLNDDSEPLRGEGSCPWVDMRWDTSPETGAWGFGPIYDILPEVMAAEELRKEGIAFAKIFTRGLWQVDNDGVINPRNVKLRPGMVLPVAPNSRGLQAVTPSAMPDVEIFNQREFKENVDRALYLDRLGSVQGTPMSATEVIERQAELGRVVGLPYGRIVESMDLMVRRKQRIMEELGHINGLSEEVQPEFLGPFARAQRLEEALAIREGISIIAAGVGDPQLMPLVVDPFATASRLSRLMNMPTDIVRTQEQALAAANELAPAIQGFASRGTAPAIPGSSNAPR